MSCGKALILSLRVMACSFREPRDAGQHRRRLVAVRTRYPPVHRREEAVVHVGRADDVDAESPLLAHEVGRLGEGVPEDIQHLALSCFIVRSVGPRSGLPQIRDDHVSGLLVRGLDAELLPVEPTVLFDEPRLEGPLAADATVTDSCSRCSPCWTTASSGRAGATSAVALVLDAGVGSEERSLAEAEDAWAPDNAGARCEATTGSSGLRTTDFGLLRADSERPSAWTSSRTFAPMSGRTPLRRARRFRSASALRPARLSAAGGLDAP